MCSCGRALRTLFADRGLRRACCVLPVQRRDHLEAATVDLGPLKFDRHAAAARPRSAGSPSGRRSWSVSGILGNFGSRRADRAPRPRRGCPSRPCRRARSGSGRAAARALPCRWPGRTCRGELRTDASTAPSRHGEVLGVLVEVRLRRGFDAVGAAAEVDRVEVSLEDLVLGQLVLDLDGEERLLDLAGVGPLLRQVEDLDVLLGDRRGALLDGVGREVVPRGADDALEVEPAVGVEGPVLGSDDGVSASTAASPTSGMLVRFCTANWPSTCLPSE